MAGGRRSPVLLHALFLYIIIIASSSGVGVGVGNNNSNIRCVERERRALLQFKQGLVDEYNLLSSWGNLQDCCQWRGIRCSNKTGRVIMLDLNGESLSDAVSWPFPLKGKISHSLLELHYLNYLDLSSNDFGGSHIPDFIGSLTKLTYLSLYDASFSGEIPYLFQNLSNLRYLDLSFNYYLNVKKVEWLYRLPSLQTLNMSFVNLTHATDWLEAITNAPSLVEVNFYICHLSDPIPSYLPVVNSSSSLAILDLGGNYFTSSIFHWLSNVSSSLVDVTLPQNQISGHFPNSIGNLCNLQRLDLSFNNISGQLSEIVHHLSNCSTLTLEVLDLSDNSWVSGSVPDLTVFYSLTNLDLSYNQLTGTVPPSIGNLTQLQTLSLASNSLEGISSEAHLLHLSKLQYLDLSFNPLAFNIDPDWSPPFQLDVIYLDSCKLGPRFPGWLRNQKKVYELSIPSAGISDAIPNWLCNLTSIVHIDLSDNKIRGGLPNLSSCFADFPRINLSSNHLEGHIPPFPSSVNTVDLSKNMFSGPISFMCATESLIYIDLSDNLLSGELPECWMHLQYLSILNLANNKLSGKIPSSMGSLVQIKVLHLQNNSFTGELPSSLKNCSELSSIDLGENRLSGIVPGWIGESLSNLVVLSLRFNAFYGSIPLEICRLAYIQIFDLSINNISGTIPNCLNNFTTMAQTTSAESNITYKLNYTSKSGFTPFIPDYMENANLLWKGNERVYSTTLGLVRVINLSSNKLMGEIPNEIMDLVGLIGLNLSRNCLTGVIDQKIGRLRMLDFLDLSRNQLSGGIPSSLSQLTYIGVLDLSYNNLFGKIPSGTQLQSFDASPYVGNSGLCGPPLTVECPRHGSDHVSTKDDEDADEDKDDEHADEDEDEDEDRLITCGFILSLGLGFAVGFLGVCGTLLSNTSCRYAYFKLLDNIKDWLYVKITVNKVRLLRGWLKK